jgi:hypothetical protein
MYGHYWDDQSIPVVILLSIIEILHINQYVARHKHDSKALKTIPPFYKPFLA